jgi:hypothetical protein
MRTRTPSFTSPSLSRTALLAVAASLAASVAAPAPAEAKRTVIDRIEVKGDALYAEWIYFEGDVVTFVALVASAEKMRTTADGKLQSDVASINILRGDTVTGNVHLAGAAYPEAFDLEVAADLSSARFRSDSIFQDDSTFTFFDLHVDLTFSGINDVIHEGDKSIDFIPEESLLIKNRWNGKHRDAVAAGTVFGTPFPDHGPTGLQEPTEFTPMPSGTALMSRNKNGSITVVIDPPHTP